MPWLYHPTDSTTSPLPHLPKLPLIHSRSALRSTPAYDICNHIYVNRLPISANWIRAITLIRNLFYLGRRNTPISGEIISHDRYIFQVSRAHCFYPKCLPSNLCREGYTPPNTDSWIIASVNTTQVPKIANLAELQTASVVEFGGELTQGTKNGWNITDMLIRAARSRNRMDTASFNELVHFLGIKDTIHEQRLQGNLLQIVNSITDIDNVRNTHRSISDSTLRQHAIDRGYLNFMHWLHHAEDPNGNRVPCGFVKVYSRFHNTVTFD